MVTTWKARPTTYRGIKMRSRLEARFAAFVDGEGGFEWEYEPRAFADEHGQYLPDFHVFHPGSSDADGLYVEVKPTVEHALLVLERMQIIRSSHPGVRLMVVVGDAPVHFYSGPDTGPRWTVGGRFPGFNA